MDKSKQGKFLQILSANLGTSNFRYYKNIRRIDRIACTVESHLELKGRLLNMGSGAFLLEYLLEDRGYTQLTAIDLDIRLRSLYEDLIAANLLKHTIFDVQDISEYQSDEQYDFIALYDCANYPGNNIIGMFPQLRGLLNNGGYLFFDVYNESVYMYIKILYKLIRKKYHNRTMYDLEKLNVALRLNGFEVKEVSIELGTKNMLIKTILKSIYFITGQALVVNYLVRKH